MPIDLIAAWLAQVTGESLLRDIAERKRLAGVVRETIDAVANEVSHESSEGVRRGLTECFGLSVNAPFALDRDVPAAEALAEAIRTQVGQLATYQQIDPPRAMFLDSVKVDLEWLKNRTAAAFIERLRATYVTDSLDGMAVGTWLSEISENTKRRPSPTGRAWKSNLFNLELLGERPIQQEDASPSQWLLARYQIVPYTGDAAETQRKALEEWLTTERQAATRLISGRGGQGKTRLAMEVAARARGQGWHVLIARAGSDGPTTDFDNVTPHSARPPGASGVLVVVDYADRWPDDALHALMAHPDLLPGAVPVRVVLLARSAQFWPPLRDVLRERGFAVEHQTLEGLAKGSPSNQERERLYTQAFTAFSKELLGCPSEPAVVPDLSAPEYELILGVHMAALTAVLAAGDGETAPANSPAVTSYLLDREQRHWRRVANRVTRTHGLGEGALRRVVALASLVSRATRREALTFLSDEAFTGNPQDLLDLHGMCYPPTVAGSVLEPLLPDRLAEDFLSLVLDQDSDQYDPACGDLVGNLLDYPDQRVSRSALTVLTETAIRHPSLTTQYLAPALGRNPALVLTLSGSIQARLVRLSDLPPSVVFALRDNLRDAIGTAGMHSGYALGMSAVVERLAEEQSATRSVPMQRANQLAGRAYWLARAGLREDALAPAEEAVDIYRRLSQLAPAVYEADLAISLNNLGIHLSQVGRREDALAPVAEAVTICRRLAQTGPAAHEPDLATSLINLGNRLSEVGRREDALAPVEEAVTIYRRLAHTDPDAHEPTLAMSLNNQGSHLAGVGRREDALPPVKEAVTIYRRLAHTNPAAYEPDLAASLNNLGIRLSEIGRREDALAPSEEATEIRRCLAQTNPAAYEPDLAASLNNLGIRLSEIGRREDALAPAREAVEIRQRLAQTNPAAYEPELAGALSNLGNHLYEAGRREDALLPAEQAVDICRRLNQTNPAAHEPALARALNNLANRLLAVERPKEALEPAELAVEIYQRLAQINPAAHEPALARALNNMGHCLSAVAQSEDALAAVEAAVDIFRGLIQTNSAAHEPDLAASLNNLSNHLFAVGRREDALTAVGQAVELYQRMAQTNPDAYELDLGMSRRNQERFSAR